VGQVRVGVSGWRYDSWRGAFYPPGLPRRRELEYVAQRLRTVEINGSFYALQRPSSYQAWAAQTPADFLFAVKGSRYITHMLRMRGAEQALANFFASGVLALEHRLGPILWQLPARQVFDATQLAAFLELLPRTTRQAAALAARHDERLEGRAWVRTDSDRRLRHVLEVRHPSFADPAAPKLLRRNAIGLVVADTAGHFPFLQDVTSDLVYVRLHGQTELYASGYDDDALDRWAARVSGWAGAGLDVLVYFDNDAEAHAPRDALRLAGRLDRQAGPHRPRSPAT
jgi:uncharacterized protein YecE (DUF72 family)